MTFAATEDQWLIKARIIGGINEENYAEERRRSIACNAALLHGIYLLGVGVN